MSRCDWTVMMGGCAFGWVGWWWVWPVLVVAGLVLVVLGVVWLMRGWPLGSGDPDAGSSARRILDERFARGEIDEDDYRRRRVSLR